MLESINKLKQQNSKNHVCIAAVYLISIMPYSCIKLHWVQLVIQTVLYSAQRSSSNSFPDIRRVQMYIRGPCIHSTPPPGTE